MPGCKLSHLPFCVTDRVRWVPFILVASNKKVSLEAGQMVISISVHTNYGNFHTLVQLYNE